tara:strand:+ start:930 stop:1466 length:537 start_codon:yes stop_codon:yes gene_type:complete
MADHTLRVSGYAVYGTAVYLAEQYGGHVRSETEVSTPTAATITHFTPVSLSSQAELSTPTAAESYILYSVGVVAIPEVSTNLLSQLHVLTSTSIETTTETLSTSVVWEHPPLGQDVDFTVYVESQNTKYLVAKEDYSNSVYVLGVDKTVYVDTPNTNNQVSVAEVNTTVLIPSVRIAA